jgi:hypothetical protein
LPQAGRAEKIDEDVEHLERTGIQLMGARRLADFDDVAHGRLALLLLDNAAETLLDRRAE